MKRILSLTLISLLSGCSLLQAPIETADVAQGTTVVDAVEGDKSADSSSSGLIDTLRNRTDRLPVIPPGRRSILRKSQSTTRQKPARCSTYRVLTVCMMIPNPVALATS